MATYKLTYFNAQGMAEVSRFIMAYGDFEYEDIRVTRDEWKELKPKSPNRRLPLLEINGETICESKAISRYLAKQAGLMGSNDLEEAKINMIVEALLDFMKPVKAFKYEKNDELKKEMGKKIEASSSSDLEIFEDMAAGKYMVGNKMSWADLEVAYALEFASLLGLTLNLDKAPKLRAIKEMVYTHPKIVAWIAKRPQTG